jgi:RHS repeat-associated protein
MQPIKRFFALLIVLMSTSSVYAQDPLNSSGVTSAHPYQVGDFDKVDLTSGNVLLHIPLLSFKQKGNLSIDYSLQYSGKALSVQSYSYQYGCDVGDDGPEDCSTATFYYWDTAYTDSFSVLPRIDQDLTTTGAGYISGYYSGVYPEYNSLGFVNEPDGSSHPMVQDSTGQWRTSDSSGYRAYAAQNLDSSASWQTGIVDRAGNAHWPTSMSATSPSTIFLQDPHNNQITYSSATNLLTDMANRQLPWFPMNSDLAVSSWLAGQNVTPTSNFSHCSGPLPISSASDVVFPAQGGGTLSYKFCFVTGQLQTNFNVIDNTLNVAEASGNLILLQSVVLPNNTTWTFEYNSRSPGDPSTVNYLDLTKVTMPTGGTISYTWGVLATCEPNNLDTLATPVTRVLTSRTTDPGGNPQTWNYSYSRNTDGTLITEVDSPPANSTGGRTITQQFYDDTSMMVAGYPFVCVGGLSKVITKDSVSGATLKTYTVNSSVLRSGTLSDANGNYIAGSTEALPTDEVTVTDGVSSEEHTTQFSATMTGVLPGNNSNLGFPVTISFGTPSQTDQFNYDGTLMRQVNTSFEWQSNPAILGANILDLPHQTSVLDGGGNPVAQTTYSYDNTGDLSTVTRAVNFSSSVTTDYQYDPTGNLIATIDPKGNTTTTTYDSTGVFPSGTQAPVVNGVPHNQWVSYDPNTGLMQSSTDQNGVFGGDANHTTSYQYDSLRRLTSVTYPPTPIPGGTLASEVTTFCYTDLSSTCPTGSTPNSVYQVSTATPSPNVSTVQEFDGLGRAVRKVILSDPIAPVITDTTYDAMGRVASISNPYRSMGDSNYGITAFAYDALDRKVTHCQPDNGNNSPCVPGNNYLQWSYTGNVTTFSDEARNTGLQTTDALGRLVTVEEPGGNITNYNYDALANLTGVTQNGAPGETPRTRNFAYDFLSRLLTAQNPETGPIYYTYDANSNLVAKTDARGVTTNYNPSASPIDPLNRVTEITHSDGTPTEYFTYDNYTGWGQPHGASIGRLVRSVTTGPSGTEDDLFSYDPRGRINHIEGATPSEAGHAAHWTQMEYDLGGNLVRLLYPSGRIVSQGFDGTGRLNSVIYAAQSTPYGSIEGGATVNYPYVSSIAYFANGSPQTINYGNGVKEQLGQNNRLQTCEISGMLSPTAGGQMVMDRQQFFSDTTGTQCLPTLHNNGNIWHIVDGTNATQGSGQRSQSFVLDYLNRITSWNTNLMDGFPRSQSYSYDSFGNMTQTNGVNMPNYAPNYDAKNHLTPASIYCSPSPFATGVDPANPGYDLSGNLLCTGANIYGAQAFVYDADGRISQAQIEPMGSNTYVISGSYSYDAQGNRIRKDLGNYGSSQYEEYVWVNGQVLTQKDQTGIWSDYIYANGKKIAKADYQETRAHAHGTFSATNNVATWTLPFSYTTPSYTIKAGDKLMFKQFQAGGAHGGLDLIINGGTWLNYGVEDTEGNDIMNDPTQGQWHARTVLLDDYAPIPSTLTYVQLAAYDHTPAGTWDIWYKDIVIVSADGTVTPIYTNQPGLTIAGWTSDPAGVISCNSETAGTNPAGIAFGSADATAYYLSDHLGTTQLEVSSGTTSGTVIGGWPVWKGEFTPFGQELDTQFTTNNYKFTGKERDTESGNDYFGARYYASSMGRFMSPDWNDDPEAVPYADFTNPQSLNLYSYGGNNPLSKVDQTGHYHCDPDTSSTDKNGVLTVTAGACHADLADYLRFTRTMMRAELKIALAARREAMSYLQVGGANCPNCQIGIMPWGMTEGFPLRGGLAPVLKGAAGVAKAVAEIESEGGTVIAREVTISNSAGTARVDLVYQDASGELKFGEAKNGPTAGLNPNQEAVYGAMQSEGATLVGGNASKANLPSSVGPTSVRVFKY